MLWRHHFGERLIRAHRINDGEVTIIACEYQIAVIGSGPSGLSAAARAALRDQNSDATVPSHILLEAFDHPAKTIQRYQKGKLVMAQPGYLDLRSDCGFREGSREMVLETWQEDLENAGVNVRFGAEVRSISGSQGNFSIDLAQGEVITAENIVLAIGLEGNPRKLGIPGEDLSRVQGHLEDPKAFNEETIVVVGAGDSALENALALAEQNQVIILNRRDEFSRAKEGNLIKILAAISDQSVPLTCHYRSQGIEVQETPGHEKPLLFAIDSPEGKVEIPCDRIITRLGAVPPRAFLESAGIAFPNSKPDALPELTSHYESNIPGLYIVGSLSGCPLIKQAMNQGYDVVEFINGNDIKPADQPLLESQFHGLPFRMDAGDIVSMFQNRIPMFSELNTLAFRELLIESNLLVSYPSEDLAQDAERSLNDLIATLSDKAVMPRTTRVIREGETIFSTGEFGTSFFTLVDGEVTLNNRETGLTTHLSRGQFFGELSLLSGRPRPDTAIAGSGCILVETPRRTMLKIMNSNEEVRAGIDWMFIVRELQRRFAPMSSFMELRDVASRVKLRSFKANEPVFEEGEPGSSMFLVRSGAAKLTRTQELSGSLVVAQIRSGELFGEMVLMGDPIRRETAIAAVALETIEIDRAAFLDLIDLGGAEIVPLQQIVTRQVINAAQMEVLPETGSVIDFMMNEGLGEATNVLVIDPHLCIGCDNCEKACAETHGGISRLDREKGPTFANVHIPISCRHCEQPHCMKDCPPNAIHRAPDGEVFIDESCIGCGNCETNCPYDVIRMTYPAPEKPGLLNWLLFGFGSGPGEPVDYEPEPDALAGGKKATKCDACLDQPRGPACVNACPTGAALRIGPEQYIELISGPGS